MSCGFLKIRKVLVYFFLPFIILFNTVTSTHITLGLPLNYVPKATFHFLHHLENISLGRAIKVSIHPNLMYSS